MTKKFGLFEKWRKPGEKEEIEEKIKEMGNIGHGDPEEKSFEIAENPEASSTVRVLIDEIVGIKKGIKEEKLKLSQNLEKIEELIQKDINLSEKISSVSGAAKNQYSGSGKENEYDVSQNFVQNLTARIGNITKMRDSLSAENKVLESKIQLLEANQKELNSILPENIELN